MEKKKGLVLGGLLLLGIGFAAVSTTLYLNADVNISANEEDFDVKFTKAVIDNEDRTSTVISEDGKTITYTTKELQALNDKSVLDFEITNNSSLYDAEVSIECTSGEKGEYYQITKEVASSIAAKTTDKGKVEVQKIKMVEEDIEEAFTCTLTAKALERTTKGEATLGVNKNIVNSDIECLKNKEAGSCAPGTEIRYMVNDTTEKIFYVLHDDGDTMTLQDSIDTVESTAWYADAQDNTKGPTTVLEILDSTTSGWSNVNTMNYEMGTTIFKDNEYTGCDAYNSCTTNTYTLGTRSAKARMITVQEAVALGCTNSNSSCPAWLTPLSKGYWTMTANSTNSNLAWDIDSNGRIVPFGASSSLVHMVYNRARAVVEINKYI